MQKFSTLLLALIACAGTIFADGTKIGNLYYNLNANNKTAEVTYQEYWSLTNYTYLTTVNIPESVEYNFETYSVTSIGEYAFMYCFGLTSVTIPNSVTSIGQNAFRYCSGLTSITIPNSVTSIGSNSFYECTGLTSITIPNSVTSIGDGAFAYCSGLTSMTIGNSVTSIGDEAFKYCGGLTSVTIGNSVISIGNYAFRSCKRLTSIEIPNSVTNIGEYAFAWCTGLTSIEIPNSVTSIGEWAFAGCTGLTSIEIPNSVTSIEEYAFYLVPNIVYSGSATGSPWGARCINGYVEGYLVYSDDTKTTLLGCSSVATGEIVIPNSVTSIGSEAFSECSGLTSVTIGNSVTSIGEYAFYGCTGLTSIEIPNSVTSIGEYAFRGCFRLTSIEIPNSVTSIGEWAFAGCTGLTSITCHAVMPPTCGNDVFDNVDKSIPLYVPEESIEAYQAAEVWKEFTNIQAIPGEPEPGTDYTVNYLDKDGGLISTQIVKLELPEPSVFAGFTFVKWIATSDNINDGINIQAIYEYSGDATSAPAEVVNPSNPAQKLIRNGKVYILTGDKTYTVTGQQLK